MDDVTPDDFAARFAAMMNEKAAAVDSSDDLRRKIAAYVATAGFERLECTFSGYGDSGVVDEGEVYVVRKAVGGAPYGEVQRTGIPAPIVEMAMRYTEVLLGQRPGWEINDGSTGAAVFKPDGSVYFDFEWRDSEATSPDPLVVSPAGAVSRPEFDTLTVVRRFEDSMCGLDVSSHLELQLNAQLTDTEVNSLTDHLNEAYRRWQHSVRHHRG